jgi:ribonuclease HI
MTSLKSVTIYTDGACIGNPGPGGYAVVLIYQGKRKEISGGLKNTTNNRMELMAAIKGLEALKEKCRVTLYSDSQYLVDSMTKGWAKRWQANGWKRNKKEYAQNVDLWQRLLKLCDRHQVEFKWTRGHVGTPENERCDSLANQAANQPDLPEDSINNDASKLDLY